MAEGSGGSSGLAFIVGGLVVAVGVIAYVTFGGGLPGGGDTNVTIEAAPGGDSGT